MITADQIKQKLKTETNLNFYQSYYHLKTLDLAKALNSILNDQAEVEEIDANELYKQNVLDFAQFIYSKYLSERQASMTAPTQEKKRPSLLSNTSLQTLYSFAV